MYFQVMESLILEIGIGAKDLDVIGSIVNQNPTKNISVLHGILLRVFGQNIKPCHFVALGFLIGYVVATDQAHNDFSKNNSLCLRQN